MKRFNLNMIFQWLIFMPLLLPMSIILGAIDGAKKTFVQAFIDIVEETEPFFE